MLVFDVLLSNSLADMNEMGSVTHYLIRPHKTRINELKCIPIVTPSHRDSVSLQSPKAGHLD